MTNAAINGSMKIAYDDIYVAVFNTGTGFFSTGTTFSATWATYNNLCIFLG